MSKAIKPEYVQAWEIKGPHFNGYVYRQDIALRKWSDAGPDAHMQILTIVRHPNGDREYLPGTIATQVAAHRGEVSA